MKLSIKWHHNLRTKMQFCLLLTVLNKSRLNNSNSFKILETNPNKPSPNKHLFLFKCSIRNQSCTIPSTSLSLCNNKRICLNRCPNRCLQPFISKFQPAIRLHNYNKLIKLNLFRHKECTRREKINNISNSSILAVFLWCNLPSSPISLICRPSKTCLLIMGKQTPIKLNISSNNNSKKDSPKTALIRPNSTFHSNRMRNLLFWNSQN